MSKLSKIQKKRLIEYISNQPKLRVPREISAIKSKLMKSLAVLLMITLCSCEKESVYLRNYQLPVDYNNPEGLGAGSPYRYVVGEPDSVFVQRIIEAENLTEYQAQFLTISPVAWHQYKDNIEIVNPDPRYMAFPHSIMSTSDNWGWDHLYELCQIGERDFNNKYFNGQPTLGMTWAPWDCSYVESWY
tara:strand:+ start:310 stop:873 length:564 start_codon:yes stop_codon:yes gene_type:complete